tara:strand:+ start:200 stop:367 length:168 start_codon:yes stop_codon:yes gene_type:complete
MAREYTTEEDKKAIEEWLAKGNKITICPPNARSEVVQNVWQRGRKKKTQTEEVKD